MLNGPEYNLLGATAGEQSFPAASIDAQGGLAVWQDNAIDGGLNGTGIAARWLGPDLRSTSNSFRVNEKLPGDQLAPDAVQLAGGGHLVVWQNRVGARETVMGRVLGSNGAFLAGEFKISPESVTNIIKYHTNWYAYTKNKYRRRAFLLKDVIVNTRELSGQAAAIALPDGGAVVVYHSARRHETNSWGLSRHWAWNGNRNVTNDTLVPTRVIVDWMQDVYLQRVSAAGQKVGPEVQVNQAADFNQRSPAIALLDNGNIVVAWVSEAQRGFRYADNFSVEIWARVFNGQAEPLGDEFQVNGPDNLFTANPAVGALAGGGFMVAWSQQEAALSRRWDVVSRNFTGAGTARSSVQLVNSYTTGDQFGPKIAALGDSQLVVWTSIGEDGSREGVYGRLYSGGAPVDDEFRVNTTTISRQIQPAIVADGQSRLLALWSSYSGASGFDLYAQAYTLAGMVTPPAGGGQLVGQAYLMLEVNRSATEAVPGRPPLPPSPLNPNPSYPPVPPGTAPPAADPGSGESSTGPLTLGVSGPPSQLQLHWNTQAGARYQVEMSADCKVWTAVGEPRTAGGATDAVALDRSRAAAFYRVIQLR